MIIKNGNVFQEDKTFKKTDLFIENDVIVSSAEEVTDKEIIDAEGCYVIPGLVDIHSHGAVGFDFSDDNIEGLKEILKYEYEQGITSYCPTSMSVEKETIFNVCKSLNEWKNEKGYSYVAGINMEGPFLDVTKKGAHRAECLTFADIDFFRECNKASGNIIRLVTLAPNIENAMNFIDELKDETVISLGHTSADYETSKEALRRGAWHVTHLFNAMNPIGHRAPGLIAAASEDDNCMVELICDGIHVHESVVRAAFKLYPDRICLISDSMRAAGMKDGTYDLGGQQVTVNGRLATLSDGTIAGSVTNVYDGMCNAISFGIPMGDAIAAATMNPAKSIGMYDKIGSLSVGKKADVLIVNKDMKKVRVI